MRRKIRDERCGDFGGGSGGLLSLNGGGGIEIDDGSRAGFGRSALRRGHHVGEGTSAGRVGGGRIGAKGGRGEGTEGEVE